MNEKWEKENDGYGDTIPYTFPLWGDVTDTGTKVTIAHITE